jgi:hypothetical protein
MAARLPLHARLAAAGLLLALSALAVPHAAATSVCVSTGPPPCTGGIGLACGGFPPCADVAVSGCPPGTTGVVVVVSTSIPAAPGGTVPACV